MALIKAYSTFYMDEYSFDAISDSSVRFFDNSPKQIVGIVYQDRVVSEYSFVDESETGVVSGDGEVVFAGNSISFDLGSREVTGGTITGIFDNYTYGDDNWQSAFSIQGISISASALYNAGLTDSETDDLALMRQAFSGADTFILSSGGDLARGYGGNDVLKGYGGNDRLLGGSGNDRLFGGADHDMLDGHSGADILTGGRGADVLTGGTGADVLTGGTGADDFVFNAAAESGRGTLRDTIRDFAKGQDDIALSAIDANTATGGNQAFRLDVGGAFSAGEIRQTQSGSDLLIVFNTDGDTAAEMSILLNNVTGPLGANDFLL